jgi:D-glycero-D-manno-heptose 1,7-bisphosphate phosphatase
VTTIFLDRDGVINENRPDYVKSWREFRFLPGSREAISRLTQAGHRLVVCTNQAAVASGTISLEAVHEIHGKMLASLREVGGRIEHVYFCPHEKEGDCACRKPRPGMLLRAREDLRLDLRGAVLIGDSITDIRAALAAGIHAVLVLSGLGWEQLSTHAHEANGPFRIALDLQHAAELIAHGRYLPTYPQSSLERACSPFLGVPEQVNPLPPLQKPDLTGASPASFRLCL